jgi:hypothetical protein
MSSTLPEFVRKLCLDKGKSMLAALPRALLFITLEPEEAPQYVSESRKNLLGKVIEIKTILDNCLIHHQATPVASPSI